MRSTRRAVPANESCPLSFLFIREIAELELHCDDTLDFEYVVDAYRSVSYYLDGDDTRVTLIKKIEPFGGLTAMMELEEMEIDVIEIGPRDGSCPANGELQVSPYGSVQYDQSRYRTE